MKRTHSMMSLLIAGMLTCAAPLALAQSSTDAQDTGLQHPQSGALTHQGSMQQYPNQAATESGSSMQSGSSSGSMSSSSTSSGQMMGEHSMSGTVTSVGSNGMVHFKSEGMDMRLHFPNASQNLKKGDKITVHLGYTKDSSSSM
ncbi:MAG TPA: hypothetical protein VN725_03385 [Rhodanobacteraceae bacterium]|nr:hypothetical protein [Rhodanobacteraceae bacterium]